MSVPHSQLKLVRPDATNQRNDLFAGTSASWFVEECYLCACYYFPKLRLVCRCIKDMQMIRPVHVGDIIRYVGECKTGKTSITVHMKVMREEELVSEGEVVFVNIDEEGKPTPHNK
ncbi:Acyl-CoA hydrolase [Entamoeba marina]